MKKEQEIEIPKTASRIDINIAILSIGFLLFTLIIAVNPELLTNNILLTLELTLTIPLLLTSCFARTKLFKTTREKLWNNFGFISFILGYGMLINVIGMFLNSFVNLKVCLIFFAANIIMALLYSTIEVLENKRKLASRFYKDAFFIILLILGGILPSLGLY